MGLWGIIGRMVTLVLSEHGIVGCAQSAHVKGLYPYMFTHMPVCP